jgi:hypothetical protein
VSEFARCRSCGEEKPLSDFVMDKGFLRRCRPCDKEWWRAWREQNRERLRVYDRERKFRTRRGKAMLSEELQELKRLLKSGVPVERAVLMAVVK